MAKHFEIPAAGTLLVTDRSVAAQLAELGFMDRVHYLGVGMDDLEEQLRYIFDPSNRAEIDAIRRRGRELVIDRHTTSHRARAIDQVCGQVGGQVCGEPARS